MLTRATLLALVALFVLPISEGKALAQTFWRTRQPQFQTPYFDASGKIAGASAGSTIGVKVTTGQVQPGDWLFVFIAARCELANFPTRFTPPQTGGWVVAEMPEVSDCTAAATNVTQAVFMRHADSSDVALPTYTFSAWTWSTASNLNVARAGMIDATIISIHGAHPTNPIDADGHMGTFRVVASNTLNGAPFAYASNGNDLEISCFAYVTTTASSIPNTPAGFSSIQTQSNGSASPNLDQGCFSKNPVSQGWIGTFTTTASAAASATAQVSQTLLIFPVNAQPLGTNAIANGGDFTVRAGLQPPDPPVGVTNYYIDNSVGGYNGSLTPTGACLINDGHAGTLITTAWCTIARLNSASITGPATVHFKCGDTWNEQLIIDNTKLTTGPDNWIVYTTGVNTGTWTNCSGNNDALITGADTILGTGSYLFPATTWTQCTTGTCGAGSTSIWFANVGNSNPASGYPHIDRIDLVDDPNPNCSLPSAGCPSSDTARPLQGLVRAADLPGCSTCATANQFVGAWANDANYVSPIVTQASGGVGEIQKMTAGSYLFYPACYTGSTCTAPNGGTLGFPADVTPGRLYVWMGNSSNPNNHRVQGGVRDWCISTLGFASGTGASWIWIRGFQLTEADGGVGEFADMIRGTDGPTHWILEYHIMKQFQGRSEDNTGYHAGISFENADHILYRHNTISYTGGHGNSGQYQTCFGCMAEYEDHSFGSHDTDDSKASDYMTFRYNMIHDSPADNLLTQVYVEGIYNESDGSNSPLVGGSPCCDDSPIEWGINTTPLVHYYNVSLSIYFNTIWNMTGAGGATFIHLDDHEGPGVEVLNNTGYGAGGTNLAGLYISSCDGGTCTSTGSNISAYCNVISAQANAANSASLSQPAGNTLNEGSNNWGLTVAGAKMTVNGFTAATSDRNLDPQWNNAGNLDFRLKPNSPELTGCNTANGLEPYRGAWPVKRPNTGLGYP